MKYIINETQINKIVSKYLDIQDFYMIEHEGNYYFFTSKLSWRNGEYAIIAYHKNNDNCFISSDILTEIAGFFSLDLDTSLNVIKNWVENNLGFKIGYSYSDYYGD